MQGVLRYRWFLRTPSLSFRPPPRGVHHEASARLNSPSENSASLYHLLATVTRVGRRKQDTTKQASVNDTKQIVKAHIDTTVLRVNITR